MIKQTWNINDDEKLRILNLHETATRGYYIIKEQASANTVVGKTDASRVSHAYLSKFGLPEGKNHENYYYSADIRQLFEMAKIGDESKYLSIFKPSTPYNDKDVNAYLDFVQFGTNNTNNLMNQGSKIFKLDSGPVYASHNGLLALKRAMEGMNTLKIFDNVSIKIEFGEHTGEEAGKLSERGFDAIKLKLNDIENQSKVIYGFQSQMSLLPIKNYSNTTLYSNFNRPKEILINVVKNWFNRSVVGLGTFLDESIKDEVIKNLTKKGYITSLKTNLDGPISELIKLSEIDDVIYNGDYSGKKVINPKKLEKVIEIGKSYQDSLINEYKQSYINNLKLFVENYVPEHKNIIDTIIPKINVPVIPLGEEFKRLFTDKYGGPVQPTSPEYDKKTKQSKIGN